MVILFIISLIIMGTMPQNFFPSLDKPYFRADVFYPDGYSINDVVKEMKSVEEHLAKQPEVKKVSITFGSTPLRYYLASTSVGPKPNFANVLVELTDSKYTKEYEENFDGYMKANYPSAIHTDQLVQTISRSGRGYRNRLYRPECGYACITYQSGNSHYAPESGFN